MDRVVYTVGHSNLSAEAFVRLLTQAQIELVADVRSSPGSVWVSFANPHSLEQILKAAGIRYLYLGNLLGGRPSDPSCYDTRTGKPDYQAMQSRELFQRGISRLLEAIDKYRLCVMCAEEDPSSCHRNLLVGDSLRQEGVNVLHVRGNGRIQTDEELWKEKAGVGISQLALPL